MGGDLKRLVKKGSEKLGALIVNTAGPVPEPEDFDEAEARTEQAPFRAYRGGDKPAWVGRHEDVVTAAAFSPDGGHAATGSADRCIKVLDTAKARARPAEEEGGEEARPVVNTLYGAGSAVTALQFHPFMPVLASGSGDMGVGSADVGNRIHFHNYMTRAELSGLACEAGVTRVEWHPRGDHLYAGVATSPILRLFDVQTGAALTSREYGLPRSPLADLTRVGHITSIAASANSVAVGLSTPNLHILDQRTLDLATALTPETGLRGAVRETQYSKDGVQLLVTTDSTRSDGRPGQGRDVAVTLYDTRMWGAAVRVADWGDDALNPFGAHWPAFGALFGPDDRSIVYPHHVPPALGPGGNRPPAEIHHVPVQLTPDAGEGEAMATVSDKTHRTHLPVWHKARLSAFAASRTDPLVITGSHDTFLRFYALETS